MISLHIKAKKFLNSFFARISLVIALTVIFTVSVIGITSYIVFSSHFNKEIIRFNTELLNHLKKTIDNSYFQSVDSLMLKLLFDKSKSDEIEFFLNNPLESNYSKILGVKESVNSFVISSNDIIDSANVYYKDNNIVISSRYGIKYINDSNVLNPFDMDWIDIFNRSTVNRKWIGTRKTVEYGLDKDENNIISFVRTLPINADSLNYKGLISINIKENTLRKSIIDISHDNFQNVFIVDTDGNILCHKNRDNLYKNIGDTEYFKRIVNSPLYNVVENISGVEMIISAVKSDFVDWYYVYMVPSEQYYQKTFIIKQIILVICTLAIVLALILSNIFSLKLTNPFSRLICLAKEILIRQNSEILKQYNEFSLLNSTLNLLSSKVNSLENILSKNRQMIAHTFYLNLLNGNITREEEIYGKLEFIGLKFPYEYFSIIIIQFNINVFNNMNFENSEYLLYKAVNDIHELENNTIPVILDRYRIALIHNHLRASDGETKSLAEIISVYINEKYNISAHISIGNYCDNMKFIHKSFMEAKSAILYAAIHPEMCMFNSIDVSKWDQNQRFSFEKICIVQELLKTSKSDRLNEFLIELKNIIKEDKISYDKYEKIIITLAENIEKAVKTMNIKPEDMFNLDVYEQIKEKYYIDDVFSCLSTICDTIMDYSKSRYSNINELYIKKVKDYIEQNMVQDISLDSAAELLHISSAHLSRIFKEQTGENFVDYVTMRRMEKAKDLLLKENVPVKVIAEMVGFNDCSYFGRKFKSCFGVTPNQYKRQN